MKCYSKNLFLLALLLCAQVIHSKPNFVFILIDDMGWKDLGCTGSTYFKTPNIDQLAKSGIMFTEATSPSPVCSPSRAAIFSGQYTARNKMTEGPAHQSYPADFLHTKVDLKGKFVDELETQSPARRVSLHPDQITFAEVLKDNGYQTGYLGKWHLGWDSSQWPDKQGFTFAEGFRKQTIGPAGHHGKHYIHNLAYEMKGLTEETYMPEALTNRAIDFITENKDETFLLVLSHYLVHAPFDAKPEKVEKWKQVPTSDQDHPRMAAMIESVDESVGQIMDTLETLGIKDDTVVIFTSDNGGYHVATSTYPLLGTKAMPYEGSHRVPLIFSWPQKIANSQKNGSPVMLIDLYPTILDLAGVQPDPKQHLDGLSLKKPLLDQGKLPERPLFYHFPHYSGVGCTPYSSVRYKNWKLYKYYNDKGGAVQLFDLSSDPNELDDLSSQNTQKVSEIHGLLVDWLEVTDAALPYPNAKYVEGVKTKWNGMGTYQRSLQIRSKSEIKLQQSYNDK